MPLLRSTIAETFSGMCTGQSLTVTCSISGLQTVSHQSRKPKVPVSPASRTRHARFVRSIVSESVAVVVVVAAAAVAVAVAVAVAAAVVVAVVERDDFARFTMTPGCNSLGMLCGVTFSFEQHHPTSQIHSGKNHLLLLRHFRFYPGDESSLY